MKDSERRDFIPLNNLEGSLVKVVDGNLPIEKFLSEFVTAHIFVPSYERVENDLSSLIPVTYDREGETMVAVFSHPTRLQHLQEKPAYGLEINCGYLLTALKNNYGIVLNPGLTYGMEFLPDGIVKIVKDFVKSDRASDGQPT